MEKKKHLIEPSRPRLDPVLRDRIDSLMNKFALQNISLTDLNNFFCGIGIQVLEKSFDSFVEKIKNNKSLKDLQDLISGEKQD